MSKGDERSMRFENNTGTRVENLLLPDSSLLVFSRQSQDGWTHSIPIDSSVESVRYSFTFRYVAPFFTNSTVIYGDSNTHNLSFGEGFGKFGKWMPGQRIKAARIQNIPGPEDISPYKNIIIHTGINDLNRHSSKPVHTLAYDLELKCRAINDSYPRTRIFLSPVLPTKDPSLNIKVLEFNRYLINNIGPKYSNIFILNNSAFVSTQGTLKPDMGRYNMGVPNISDPIHLGRKGITLFAKQIKSSVMNRVILKSATSNSNHAAAGKSVRSSLHHDVNS